MSEKILDSWKRPTEVQHVFTDTYEQQLELQLNATREATPEEFNEWQEKELNWWADRQLNFVAIATIVQLTALGFMAAVMGLNQYYFG